MMNKQISETELTELREIIAKETGITDPQQIEKVLTQTLEQAGICVPPSPVALPVGFQPITVDLDLHNAEQKVFKTTEALAARRVEKIGTIYREQYSRNFNEFLQNIRGFLPSDESELQTHLVKALHQVAKEQERNKRCFYDGILATAQHGLRAVAVTAVALLLLQQPIERVTLGSLSSGGILGVCCALLEGYQKNNKK